MPVLAIDFDDTIVEQDHAYDDLTSPLVFKPGAHAALRALRAAPSNTLLLYSGRASRALREDPMLDPLVRAGVKPLDRALWERRQPVNVARYEQMLAFVAAEIPGVFHAIDDGQQGKPSADKYIDDKALQFGGDGQGWAEIARAYGTGAPMQAEDAGRVRYAALLGRMRDLSQIGVVVQEIGATKVGPILVLSQRLSGRPTLAVVAGQHGDEDAGPLMLYHHAADLFARAEAARVSLRIYPCVNPEGFDAQTRYDADWARPTNAFLQYLVPTRTHVDGRAEWVGELPPGVTPLAVETATRGAPETRSLILDWMRRPRPDVVVDLHQDSMVPHGQAFAYVFGNRAAYATALVGSARPMARKRLENASWTDAEIRLATDANGLVEFYDGSLTDYAWRAGARLSSCLETSLRAPVADAQRAARAYVLAMLKMTAAGTSAR